MWRSGHFRLSEMLGATSLQRVNHFSKSGVITNKGKLLRAHRKARSVFGKTYEFVPTSFLLPTEYTKFVKTFSEQETKRIWICKPDNSACGRKIFLIRDLSDLKYDQQVVVQSYIERPLTIGGYKVDLRLYVLVRSFRPFECYLYRDGLARFGTQKYNESVDLSNLYAHLTNTSINKHSRTCKSNKDVIGAGCKWDFLQLREWAEKTTGIDWNFLWARIRHCIIMTLLLAIPVVRQEPQCFELFGFDIIIDEKLKPWLLEVNCSPALNMDEPTDRRVKPALLRDTMTVLKHQNISSTLLQEASAKGRARRAANEKQGARAKNSSQRARHRNDRSKLYTTAATTTTTTNRNHRGGRGRNSSSSSKNKNRNGSSSSSSSIQTESSATSESTTTEMYKHMDFLAPDIGNFEKLFPFNEETTKYGNAVANVADDMEMQEKIKDIVSYMKKFEKILLSQQRKEILAKRKKMNENNATGKTMAKDGRNNVQINEEQVKAAAKLLQ